MALSVIHSMVQVGFVLVLMVGLIFALGWLAKKTQTFGLQGGKHIALLQTLPLGQKEKAVLIELDGNRILLGVTANQVSTLWTASVASEAAVPGDLAQSKQTIPEAGAPSFANALKTVLSKNILNKDSTC